MGHQIEWVGQKVGNYRLEQLLGSGGFADVYLGRHVYLDSLAAIKLLHTNLTQGDIEGFRSEAMTLVRLIHPHIVRILDFGVEDTTPFLVMDFAPNGTLRQRHRRGEQLPLRLVVTYVKQIAGALQYAHDHNIIHRDIKPENMLFGREREILLSDFGIAVVAQTSRAGLMHDATGTIAYMAPEQIQGHPRKASDQYSLATVVYEWLTGSPPFIGSFTQVAGEHIYATVPSLRNTAPTIAPEVEQVVLTALAKDPKQRFESVHAFETALEQASKGRYSETPASDRSFPAGTSPTLPATPLALFDPAQELDEQEVAQLMAAATHVDVSDAYIAMAANKSNVTEVKQKSETKRPWNVPFLRNPYFTGRENLLSKLHELLSAAPTRIRALAGLGGIGKTQLAIEYAYRYQQAYSAVFWVRASSREMLVADFIALAHLLQLPGRESPDQMSIVGEVKSWLMQHMEWLLILDNVEDLSLVTGFLPTNSEGRILMTTRAQALGRVAESLTIEELPVEEGMLLLLRRTRLLAADQPLEKASPDVRVQAEPIVRALDGLPLALDQAGAYIEETRCNLSEYLALYSKRRTALLNRQSGVPQDYPYTVAGTWAISFQQVEERNPAAAELLRFCAFLKPDAIPEEMLVDGAPWLGPILEPAAADPFLLNEAVQILRLFSLIKRDPDEKLLNIHRLVQAVLKDGLDAETQRLWGERTVRAVNAAFPEVSFDTWRHCERCLPHVQMCVPLIEQYDFTFPEAARLLHLAGCYLLERGIFEQGEQLLLLALKLRERTVGPDHPETAATLNLLANVARDLGHFEQAERDYQRALAIQERELGPEHPEVATTLYDMAFYYHTLGKYQQAEPLEQRALAIREKVFGSEHPLIADLLNDLAIIYEEMGKYEQSELLLQRALAILEKSYGPDHPTLAIPLNNLARIYKSLGRHEQAVALSRRAITIQEHSLGPEHPEMAYSLSNLGDIYGELGDYEQAEQLIVRSLAIREQTLGPMHHLVSTSLRLLAKVYSAQEKYEQAEVALLRSLAIQEHIHEPNHPRIAHNLYLLARVYDAQGAFEQAIAYYHRTLAIQQSALGEEHPRRGPPWNISPSYSARYRAVRKRHCKMRKHLRLGDNRDGIQ